MLLSRVALGILSAGLIGTSMVCGQTTSTSPGQAYPNKTIRVVTSEAGGGSDFVARLMAPGLSDSLRQPVVVDNRPSGVIPGDIVSKAPPDGYTLLVAGGIHWIAALLQKMPYDPVADFSPITLMTSSPSVLVVHPSVPVKSVKELIALAKARPGELNYASGSVGGPVHIAAELFKSMATVNIVRIPYKGTGPALTSLIGGETQLMFAIGSSVAPHVKSGRLRALAVSSAQPSALAPGLPTVAASGLPGYDAVTITGVFAPRKTPAALINRLNQELVRDITTTEVKERLLKVGMEAVGSSPEQFAGTIKSEMARIGKVIKDAGITAE